MSGNHPSAQSRKELTIRGLILGVVITVVFTAANVFFGLKAGLTFATSIPAAVISMALLRGFKDSTIQENNIVQTIASAAGTLSSIIFVLPGLIMIGWWTGFPFWISFAVCALGGILGVMYSIPLRRALVTNSDLPYPEGVACAEVLKVGSGDEGHEGSVEEGRAGLMAVLWGSIVSAVFAVVVATQVFASDVVQYFRVGNKGAVSGFDFNLSFALFAIGHLVGLSVGIAMLIGAVIGWVWGVPHYSLLAHAAGTRGGSGAGHLEPQGALRRRGCDRRRRDLDVGEAGAAGDQRPELGDGCLARAQGGKADSLPRTEQDIPIGIVGLITLACFIPIAWLLGYFGSISGLGDHVAVLAIGGVAFVVLMGFFVSTVCGYMAGLIGSSNSPLSGVGILVVIGAALLLVAGVKPYVPEEAGKALVAFALFVTSVVFTVAAIANNNLQDLKTGQLVDATPWRQQVALVIGVIAGAAVIPPVLDLLNHAYGFAGAPGAGAHALPAPQAGLISALGARCHHQEYRLEPDRHGHLDWLGGHRGRRDPGAHHQARAGAAAGRGPRYLPAHVEHADGGGGLTGRLVLRPSCGSLGEAGSDQATRRAARLGPDRRRERDRCGDRCRRGVLRQGGTVGSGWRGFRRCGTVDRRHRLRRGRVRALSVGGADGQRSERQGLSDTVATCLKQPRPNVIPACHDRTGRRPDRLSLGVL